MTAKAAKRRFSSVALALLASLIIGGIAAPIIVSVGSDRISVGSSRLVAAPRDSVMIGGPTALGPSKFLTIERGLLFPVDGSGRVLDAPLSKSQLAGGSARFAIENGIFRVQAVQNEAATETSSPLLDAVAGLQFETLVLRQATVHILLPDGRTESVNRFDGEISPRRKASLTIKGKGDLRGQMISLDVTSGILADARPGGTVPLKMTLKSALLEAAFDGRVGFIGPAQMQGAIEFTVRHVRQVARWFGAPWPAGSGLQNLSGQGQLAWAGPAMAFNRGTFQIDRNEASGTLHLNFANARPTIGGTLALKSLDLGQYFLSSDAPAASSNIWSSLLGTDLSIPLASHFDADLRISADKVMLGALQLGRSAAAVTVAQGRMLADVGAFEFDGGRGNGQVSADMSGALPKVAVRGRLDDIDAARIAAGLFGHAVVTGKATITADVASNGKAGGELLLASQGRLYVELRNGGRIGADLRGLSSAAQKRATEGWGNAARGQTPFDTLDASFALRAGALVADDVKFKSGEVTTIFAGQIDVPTNRLNMSVEQPTSGPFANKPGAITAPLSLQIFGPWNAPTVRDESGRERAADPSLPGAMPQAPL